MKHLQIDLEMKTLWPATRVGCFQYQVNVEKKNEEMWKYLKKDIFRKAKNAIFDYGINEIPNIKEARQAYKAFGKDPSRYRVSSEAEKLIRESEKTRSVLTDSPCLRTMTGQSEVLQVIPNAP